MIRRTLAWAASAAVAVALAALWFAFLRPASLGGPATYVIVAGESMRPALRTGDLVLALESKTYRPGDVVVFRVPSGEPGAGTPIIHRIVAGSAGSGFALKGDNRELRDPWLPPAAELDGRSVLAVPRLGFALAFLRSPVGLAAAAGLLAFLLVAGGPQEHRRPAPTILRRA